MVKKVLVLLALLFVASCRHPTPYVKTFSVRGIAVELKPETKTALIRHERISGYMNAMTMPFKVQDTNELTQLRAGDQIRFRLLVSEDESWIDHITKRGANVALTNSSLLSAAATNAPAVAAPPHPLMGYAFTNQLGHPMTLASFRGQ